MNQSINQSINQSTNCNHTENSFREQLTNQPPWSYIYKNMDSYFALLERAKRYLFNF